MRKLHMRDESLSYGAFCITVFRSKKGDKNVKTISGMVYNIFWRKKFFLIIVIMNISKLDIWTNRKKYYCL